MVKELITLTQTCPMCGNEHSIEVDANALADYRAGGKLIQDCFPDLTPLEREFIKTGYCPDCQDLLFTPPGWWDDDNDEDLE